jgi:hypothetical protein
MFDDLFGETYRADSPSKKKKSATNGYYEQPFPIGSLISHEDFSYQEEAYKNFQSMNEKSPQILF